jgi:hypothetical protein
LSDDWLIKWQYKETHIEWSVLPPSPLTPRDQPTDALTKQRVDHTFLRLSVELNGAAVKEMILFEYDSAPRWSDRDHLPVGQWDSERPVDRPRSVARVCELPCMSRGVDA